MGGGACGSALATTAPLLPASACLQQVAAGWPLSLLCCAVLPATVLFFFYQLSATVLNWEPHSKDDARVDAVLTVKWSCFQAIACLAG